MALYNVRILTPYNGYKAGSVLTMTDKAYYEARKQGHEMNIIANTSLTKPDPRDQKDEEE